MKLSAEITSGLKKMSANHNDDEFSELIRLLSHSMDKNSNTIEMAGSSELKQSYAALFSLIVESVRFKEDDSSIRVILNEAKISEERVNMVLSLLQKQRIPLQISLKQVSSQFPHILDVTWKMSYVVKSSYSDIDGKALFLIDFIVGASKRNRDHSLRYEAENVQVVCTINQLQSLVAALKAATRKLEAIADLSR